MRSVHCTAHLIYISKMYKLSLNLSGGPQLLEAVHNLDNRELTATEYAVEYF